MTSDKRIVIRRRTGGGAGGTAGTDSTGGTGGARDAEGEQPHGEHGAAGTNGTLPPEPTATAATAANGATAAPVLAWPFVATPATPSSNGVAHPHPEPATAEPDAAASPSVGPASGSASGSTAGEAIAPSSRAYHEDVLGIDPEALRAVHVGDRTVRLRRGRIEGVRRVDRGVYEIVSEPETRSGLLRTLRRLRRTLIGAPIRSEHEGHERLANWKALSVFGSDNISSSAYATEEIMRVLLLAGTASLSLTVPLALAIVALLAIVVTSYQQTIRAYPKGGGSYIVSSDNLGVIAGLVAGCSIQVGYILTVAVSVSAGVSALTSAFPAMYENRVLIAVVAVAIMAWGNLRGIRESGSLFAAPAYLYLAILFGILGYGLFRFAIGDVPAYTPPEGGAEHAAQTSVQALSLFLILRAFTSGAVGLTGTEAIADGVSAFKAPENKNARLTLVTMAACFAIIFLGISVLSHWLGIIPDPREVETLNSQLTRTLVGVGPVYYVAQFATALLLVLAANTAFADFPRLAYFLARDKFLPSHFTFRGERLAFSNGILILAVVAAALIVLFQGSVTALIPLYAVGVFVGFTLSQAALVRRWWRLREPGWRWRLSVNATGAVVTTMVAVVAAVTRFTQGAWVVLVLVPALVTLLLYIRRHYHDVADQLSVDARDVAAHRVGALTAFHHYVLVPVADLNRATLRALDYARSITGAEELAPGQKEGRHVSIQAVHVTDDADNAATFQERWSRLDPGVELVILEAPYRQLVAPLLRYIDAIERRHPEGDSVVTVLLPEFVPARWWEHLLHTHTALQLKGALLFRQRTVVTSVPYHLHS